jgi:hypothetical protein
MQSTFVKIVDDIKPKVVPRIIPDLVGYESITELRNGWLPVASVAYKPKP